MALITCPECGKQISESTPSCPHCGYILSTTSSPAPTKIGETEVNIGGGIAVLALGVVGGVASLFALFLFFPIGIFAMVGSCGLLGVGYSKIKGTQEVYCPHCGKLGRLEKAAENYKCPVCKKRSVRNGDYLKPM